MQESACPCCRLAVAVHARAEASVRASQFKNPRYDAGHYVRLVEEAGRGGGDGGDRGRYRSRWALAAPVDTGWQWWQLWHAREHRCLLPPLRVSGGQATLNPEPVFVDSDIKLPKTGMHCSQRCCTATGLGFP
jgi:hypothetical protein